MLYLVGGVARAGKSITASVMLERYSIPYLSLDSLRWGLTKGAPSLGIHSDNNDHEDAERLWPMIEAIIENILFDGRDYLIEGVCLLPKLVSECRHANPNNVRTCFLGYPQVGLDEKVNATMNYEGPNDWLRRLDKKSVRGFIGEAIQTSMSLKTECESYSIPFINSGSNFPRAINESVNVLTDSGARRVSR